MAKCPSAASDNLDVARYVKIIFFAAEHLYGCLLYTSDAADDDGYG